MLVCLTTSNFPDVMLPGYNAWRGYAILFIIYMVLGLFLFMSLVLAIFYSNFKIRYENKINKDEKKRNDFLYKNFEEFGGIFLVYCVFRICLNCIGVCCAMRHVRAARCRALHQLR